MFRKSIVITRSSSKYIYLFTDDIFKTAEQLERACLEDVVMAKLHGLTMGLDVCATFHMGIEPLEGKI